MKNIFNIALAFIFIFNMGCSSMTRIRTNKGVSIRIDGNFLGKGRALYEDTALSFSTKEVILDKKGCDPQYNKITKNKIMLGPTVVGFFFLWPLWLWSFGYNDYYTFRFKCRNE